MTKIEWSELTCFYCGVKEELMLYQRNNLCICETCRSLIDKAKQEMFPENDKSYIQLAVESDRDGALKAMIHSLGNLNPTRHFI